MVFNGMKMNEIPINLNQLDRISIFKESAREAESRLVHFDADVHKGIRGHAALVAGSSGMMGAALLALKAASSSGCGKITAIAPANSSNLVHNTIPEALFRNFENQSIQLNNYQSIGIGPGSGNSPALHAWIKKICLHGSPAVFDADALNMLATDKTLFMQLPHESILTPHLGEWERLFGKSTNDKNRINTSIDFCKSHNINILIKGHYSVFINPKGNIFINGTGNAGMAKAGSGDVLTGILISLLAQGYSPESTGIVGMFIHGLAGDFAKEKTGDDGMKAADIIDSIPEAFKTLRKGITFP
jgi:ADP-dependent NAD(P)H-hydrate dehydratase / NAD(P)H-hydrate epimerase